MNTAGGSGSDVGTGGMETKLVAADLATNAGVHTLIMKSDTPANIGRIVEYMQTLELDDENKVKQAYNGDLTDLQKREFEKLKALNVPLHTKFIANDNKHHLKNREFWILHGLVSKGAVVIDQGAYAALTRKNKAGLLPAGVIDVQGTFHELECVDIKVGKKLPDGTLDPDFPLQTVGKARCNYTSSELTKIKGLHSDQIEEELGYNDSEYVAHRENLAFPPR